ncbi:Hypothetical protein FKW44_009461 [Caligus rogercresseyi]|uniref:Uncharacterized protein n=1 Tax=Caligus rogercresseyi TaxID=217165 RepID=A0A7T8K7H6_CALRO|nr:Hypothetical protein FKW44_009461 [Caligus rogercresseyi]
MFINILILLRLPERKIWCEARFHLGPILYLVLVADVTSCVGIGDEDNSSYADDFFLWAVGDSLEEVGLLLETKADAFSKYAGGMVSSLTPPRPNS